jgi:hypothetical protein
MLSWSVWRGYGQMMLRRYGGVIGFDVLENFTAFMEKIK